MSDPQPGDLQRVINETADVIHSNAIAKGFVARGQKRPIHQHVALIHSEVSEVLEHDREARFDHPSEKLTDITYGEEELADIIIRVLDLAEEYHMDVGTAIRRKLQHNLQRDALHGKSY